MSETKSASPVGEAERLNGIDTARVRLAQEEMRRDPDGPVASPVHKVAIIWQNGYRTRTEVSGGNVIQGDEPPTYGGQGDGATPQELLLTAVGHCLIATYVGGLAAAGVAIRSLKVSVSGKVNFRAAYGVEKGHAGFESVEIAVDIDADASPARVEQLLDRLLPTSPIPDTIMRPVPLTVKLRHADHEGGSRK